MSRLDDLLGAALPNIPEPPGVDARNEAAARLRVAAAQIQRGTEWREGVASVLAVLADLGGNELRDLLRQ